MAVDLKNTTISVDSLNQEIAVRKQAEDELKSARTALEKKVKELAFSQDAALNMMEDLERENIERKKAEEKQAELLEKIESVNQELRDFAYIVSHDLKAPLRGIKSITGFLADDYADKFDEEGRKQLELLVSRVDRMQALIEGVLNYSRVGRVEEDKVPVDLNVLLPEIIDLIAPPENISITIENEMPVIMFERTRISQVFQNLLSNAVKYMDKPQGRIKVGCVKENDFWKFSVADNGPGIEEKYFEKIFKVFQTLSRRDDVEGTGIGLSIVKKIISTYDGSIWIESEVGKGSTFFFTLPLHLQAPEAALAEMEAKT
jgi:light-regulated signal transduction histidine kinase (bacteriophytochrome)